MARRRNELESRYRPRVVGDLAVDPAYEERRRQEEYEREAQREEFIRPPQPKPRRRAAPAKRPREHVSLAALTAFLALAGMVALLLACRAQLTAISTDVVSMRSELSTLEEEHVELLSKYEKTFDLAAIKEAAAAAGMNKPSASQIYYIDLSEPDSVIVYQEADESVLGRVLSSVGQGVCSVVEYFK